MSKQKAEYIQLVGMGYLKGKQESRHAHEFMDTE